MEFAIPQYLSGVIAYLADQIHALPGNKRIVVVIPPYVQGYPSSEVFLSQWDELTVGFVQSSRPC